MDATAILSQWRQSSGNRLLSIEIQQKSVLDGTVALTKQVEAQIVEVFSRGWNFL